MTALKYTTEFNVIAEYTVRVIATNTSTCEKIITTLKVAGLFGQHVSYLSCKTDITSEEHKWHLNITVFN